MNDATELHPPAPDEGNFLFGTSLAVGNFITNLSSQFPSLAVGAPNFTRVINGDPIENSGKVYVFNPIGGGDFNLENTLFPDENWVPYTRAFGYSLAGGNFNADAEGGQEKDDLAIGAPDSSIPEHDGIGETGGIPSGDAQTKGAGLVFISAHEGNGLNVLLIPVTQDRMGVSNTKDHFGRSLSAGDFNNDGTEDLAIGSPDEKMAGSDLTGAKGAGALYFRFGIMADWDAGGGIPSVPTACFDYIDAVRNLNFSHKKDAFGSVLLAAKFDGDDHVDLIVGAPSTDMLDVINAGAVWIGLNQTTAPGVFEGKYEGPADDDNGEFNVTMNIHNREGAVCGIMRTDRDLQFDDLDVEQPCLTVAAIHDDTGHFVLDNFKIKDPDGKSLGKLSITVDKQGDDIINLNIVFDPKKGENVERIVSTTLIGDAEIEVCH